MLGLARYVPEFVIKWEFRQRGKSYLYRKLEFLDEVNDAWDAFQSAIANCDWSKLERPGVEGTWSVKDIMAHITWFEQEMAFMLQTRTLAGSKLWELPQDERNRIIYEQNHPTPLAVVRSESNSVHEDLVLLIQLCSDEELNQAARFESMPSDWIPAEVLASNTYEHYRDHITAIQAWSSEGKLK
jgi:hypothetical protein